MWKLCAIVSHYYSENVSARSFGTEKKKGKESLLASEVTLVAVRVV